MSLKQNVDGLLVFFFLTAADGDGALDSFCGFLASAAGDDGGLDCLGLEGLLLFLLAFKALAFGFFFFFGLMRSMYEYVVSE